MVMVTLGFIESRHGNFVATFEYTKYPVSN